jgi:hypothetical protein
VKLALLCNGPSLPDFWCDDLAGDYDIVVAVNTAGWHYFCDWECAVDRSILVPFFVGERPLPRAGFLSNKGWKEQILARGRRFEFREIHAEAGRLGAFYDIGKECAFTMPKAVVFAESLCPDGSIEVFGFDCSDSVKDFAGVDGMHGLNRWRAELAWLRQVWQPRIRVQSLAPDDVLAFVRKETDVCERFRIKHAK